MAPITMLSRSTVEAMEAEVERLPDALAEAKAAHDPVRGVALVLAARRGGRACQVDPADILWLLQRIDDPVLVPCLAGACGQPLSLLLDFLESEPLVDPRAAALVTSALLLDDQPISDELVALFTRSVARLGLWQTGPVGMAFERLSNPALQALARRLRPPHSVTYHGTLETMKRGLAGDFDSALREALDDSQPLRRTEPKVGRNDSCPCGSGLKFKKCCQGKATPKVYTRWVPPAQFVPFRLPLHHVVQLRPQALDSRQLYLLIEDLSYRGPIDLAEEALDELLSRSDPPHSHDEALEDLILGASERCPSDRLLLLAQRLQGETPRSAQLKSHLLAALHPQVQKVDASWASLLDKPGDMANLALYLRRSRPALSLLLARLALVQGNDEWEGEMLLGGLGQTRARLGLEPDDPIEEIWERLQDYDDEEESDEPDPAMQALQKELTEARQRLRQLEIAKSRPPSPAKTRPVAAPAPELPSPPAPDPEVKRLRERLQEVKALLRERNQERTQLRDELKNRAAAPVEANPPVRQEESEPEFLEFESATRPPLLPEWTRTATQELRELPVPTARLALRLTGELAAGLPSTWHKTKPILAVEGIHSIRLGLNHRMLFRPEPEAGILVVHHLVTRGDHDHVIKQMTR